MTMKLVRKVLKDITTGIDGETFDAGRVVGYGLCVTGTVGFMFCAIWSAIHDAKFDPQAYGIGFGALMTSLAAVAGGLKLKESTEPQPSQNTK